MFKMTEIGNRNPFKCIERLLEMLYIYAKIFEVFNNS